MICPHGRRIIVGSPYLHPGGGGLPEPQLGLCSQALAPAAAAPTAAAAAAATSVVLGCAACCASCPLRYCVDPTPL